MKGKRQITVHRRFGETRRLAFYAPFVFVSLGIVAVAGFLATRHGYIEATSSALRFGSLLLVASSLATGSWVILRGAFFTIFGMVLLAAIAYHATLPAVTLISPSLEHIYFIDELYSRISDVAYLEALYLSSLGLVAYSFGGLLFGGPSAVSSSVFVKPAPREAEAALVVAVTLLGLTILPFFENLASVIRRASEYGYAGRWEVEASDLLVGKAAALTIVSAYYFLALGRTRYRKIVVLVSGAILLSHVSAYLYLGDRARALLPIVGALWIWNKCVARVRYGGLLLVGLLLVLLYGAVQASRRVAGPLGEKLAAALSFDIGEYSTMGVFILVFAAVIDLVPKLVNFSYGASYFSSLWLFLPNIGDGAHPAVALLPRKFVAEYYFPQFADHFDLGFSVMAEGYYNFGWLGVPCCLFLLGVGLSRISKLAESNTRFFLMPFFGVLIWQLVFLPRTYLGVIPRQVVWYGLLPLLFFLLVYAFLKRPTRHGH
jgi:oligosaccharide repeat unit polymerase